MNRYSIVDQSSPIPPRPATSQAGAPALHGSGDGSLRFPGEDGGKSLAETARGDVDAALQLLVERAKYITGALAATIALYEEGELVCHACTGAPRQKLRSRLLVGSGLSNESVRTRRILRCNDTSNDERTNPEICRKYGIASAMVMDFIDYGLGVFRADAFTSVPAGKSHDLATLYQSLLRRGQLAGYEVRERFYEIGSPEGLKETSDFIASQRLSGQ